MIPIIIISLLNSYFNKNNKICEFYRNSIPLNRKTSNHSVKCLLYYLDFIKLPTILYNCICPIFISFVIIDDNMAVKRIIKTPYAIASPISYSNNAFTIAIEIGLFHTV